MHKLSILRGNVITDALQCVSIDYFFAAMYESSIKSAITNDQQFYKSFSPLVNDYNDFVYIIGVLYSYIAATRLFININVHTTRQGRKCIQLKSNKITPDEYYLIIDGQLIQSNDYILYRINDQYKPVGILTYEQIKQSLFDNYTIQRHIHDIYVVNIK